MRRTLPGGTVRLTASSCARTRLVNGMKRLLCLACALATALAAPIPAEAAIWVPSAPAGPGGITSLSLFSDGTGYAYHSESGALLGSSDMGKTWAPANQPPRASVLRFGSPSVGYGVASGTLQRTTDGARSWRALPGPAPPPGREIVSLWPALAVARAGQTVAFTA